MATITVKDIVKDWLKTHGYDGLLDDDGCGCTLDDFCPCGTLCDGTPAYKWPCLRTTCPNPDECEGGHLGDHCLRPEKPEGKVSDVRDVVAVQDTSGVIPMTRRGGALKRKDGET